MKSANTKQETLNQIRNSADGGKKGAFKMNLSKTISSPEHEVVEYYYKLKKQKSKNKSTSYFVQPAETTSERKRLALYENSTDESNCVVIKFFLPESADTELILMDSDKRDAMCFISERLEAGNHTFRTEIRNEELARFTYYYRLNVNGFSEVRKMEYSAR